MSDKLVKKFARHRQALARAAEERKSATKARKAIRGLGGPMGDLVAFASDLSTEAVQKELDALRAERRALKKLHGFAVRTAAAGQGKSGRN